jgi:hypothetical protein
MVVPLLFEMRNVRPISRRLTVLATAFISASALPVAVGAAAAGNYTAHARRPAYDAGALELRGQGAYTTARSHSRLRVTVCLQKRLGARVYSVRCETGTGSGRRVTAEVSVPGCVKGAWRTASTGEALDRKGEWVHQARAISAPYKC